MQRLALAGLAALCCGCSFLETELGRPMDPADLEAFEPGRTRRAEVLSALGPPIDLEPHADGVAFLYEHVLINEKQFGLNLDELGIWLGIRSASLLKLSLGGTTSVREATLLIFDGEGTLVAVDEINWDENLGKGGSLQLFFAVTPVVDYGSVRDRPRALRWGTELLERPPFALNQLYHADLELRGTPVRCGQKALEMRPWKQPRVRR